MRNYIIALTTFIALSASANASEADSTNPTNECRSAATEIAKMNMDQKAKSYGFDSASVSEAVYKKSIQKKYEKNYVYSVESNIYKASYTATVVVDSSCGAISISIQENL